MRRKSVMLFSLAGYGIPGGTRDEFIRNTLLITSRMSHLSEYNKKRALAAKKGKKSQSLRMPATHRCSLSFIYLLVGIQTAIPSIRTRKQLPGYKKSFEGFPLDGSGDDSAITYIACVANRVMVVSMERVEKDEYAGHYDIMKVLSINLLFPIALFKQCSMRNAPTCLRLRRWCHRLDISQWQTFLPPLRPLATVHERKLREI